MTTAAPVELPSEADWLDWHDNIVPIWRTLNRIKDASMETHCAPSARGTFAEAEQYAEDIGRYALRMIDALDGAEAAGVQADLAAVAALAAVTLMLDRNYEHGNTTPPFISGAHIEIFEQALADFIEGRWKAYADAEAAYQQILSALIAELKKTS